MAELIPSWQQSHFLWEAGWKTSRVSTQLLFLFPVSILHLFDSTGTLTLKEQFAPLKE